MAARRSTVTLVELARLPSHGSSTLRSSSRCIQRRAQSTFTSTGASSSPSASSSAPLLSRRNSWKAPEKKSSALGTQLTPSKILSHFSQAPFAASSGTGLLGDNAELACRAMTHESYRNAIEGHNRRLAFLGRRSMKMFTTLFLHTQLLASSDEAITTYIKTLLSSPLALDEVLTTQRLGDKIGRHLELEKVMRWTPAVMSDHLGPKETGLFKVRGVCVEALLGAVYHQSGAQVANEFFNASILPALIRDAFPAPVPAALKSKVLPST